MALEVERRPVRRRVSARRGGRRDAARPIARSERGAPDGAERVAPAVPAEQRPNSDESQLPIALLGTFAANEPSLSRATLRDRESGRTLMVAIGTEIEQQAVVVQIERERVVLHENGATRELRLDGAEHGADQAPPRRPDEDRSASSRDGAHAMVTYLLHQAQVLPKFEDGDMVGLQVSAIQAGSLFEEIGLENGDVITEFNDIAIDSQAKSFEILQKMADAHEYHVVGRRADGTEHIWDFVPED